MRDGTTKPRRSGLLPDVGMVGLVVGGIASLLLGLLTIGVGAIIGRIPSILGILFCLTSLTAAAGLVITIATRSAAGSQSVGSRK